MKSLKPVDGLLFGCLVLLIALLAVYYVSRERTFYYWDYDYYYKLTLQVAQDLRHSPMEMLKELISSTNSEYNAYFTVPLLPLIFVFGSSRTSYILSLLITYQVPYALTIGAISTRLVQSKPRLVFWSGSFIAFLVPICLGPALRGYPDVAAAWMVALAILLYILDIRLDRWWSAVFIGLFLGTAILLRRHFAYDAIIFLFVMVAHQGLKLIRITRKDRSSLKPEMIRLLKRDMLAGGVMVVILVIFGLPILARMILIDYQALYASYTAAPAVVLKKFFTYYGWIIVLFALVGYSLAMFKDVIYREVGWYLIVFGLVSLFVWVVIIRISATHYTLHLTFILILGIVALVWTFWLRLSGKWRILAILMFTILVLTNWIFSLTPAANKILASSFISLPYPPLYRSDYSEISRLVAYLRTIAGPDDLIYVVDTSQLMNDSLLRNAEAALYPQTKLNIPSPPQVDTRDVYPLELLLRAKYVVTADPFQSILDPADEQVAEVVHDAFYSNWEIANDFKLLPTRITLENGAEISIYKRIRSTEVNVATTTFNRMYNFINERPGRQKDWIILNRPAEFNLNKINANTYAISFNAAQSDPGSPTISLLYASPISTPFSITGNSQSLHDNCPQAQVDFQTTNQTGQVVEKSVIDPTNESENANFLIPFEQVRASNLLVVINLPVGQRCSGNLQWSINQDLQ